MWLLHTRELRLEEFYGSRPPRYAILSHRWEQEISFQELQQAIAVLMPTGSAKLTGDRFTKIQKTRELATSRDKLDWVWIDTCCINKESSAGLSEAINSMYRYYSSSAVCYAYLSDVRWGREPQLDTRLDVDSYQMALTSFKDSAWFSRGWTLQELLAPSQVLFFDRDWQFIGERNDFAQHISSITKISEAMLRRTTPGMPVRRTQRIVLAPVAEKMSWAAKRHTTRQEDLAYSLLGLFDVSMPLLYGEGGKAFMRLQLEIIRKGADESIFAWRREAVDLTSGASLRSITKTLRLKGWERAQIQEHVAKEKAKEAQDVSSHEPKALYLRSGFLAQQASDFAESGHIKWTLDRKFVKRMPYSMSNQGLQFYAEAYPSSLRWLNKGDRFDVKLNCYESHTVKMEDGSQGQVDEPIVLSLVKERSGDDQAWRRYDSQSFQGPLWERFEPGEQKVSTAFYIRQDGL
jgi:hypothetical protein